MARTPQMQRIVTPDELSGIVFTDGLAVLTMPAEMLVHVRFKNDYRENGPRLAKIQRAIMQDGYVPMEPIIVRIGQKGKWVVVDGGHRLTAARLIAASFWRNIFSRKVGDLYFLLFTGPRSWTKLRDLAPQAALGQVWLGAPAPDIVVQGAAVLAATVLSAVEDEKTPRVLL